MTTITYGSHRIDVTRAISEPGIVIQSEGEDLVVIPVAVLPRVLDAIADLAPTPHQFVRTSKPTAIASRCACGETFEAHGRDGIARDQVQAWELKHRAAAAA